jgi:hypothetical protein
MLACVWVTGCEQATKQSPGALDEGIFFVLSSVNARGATETEPAQSPRASRSPDAGTAPMIIDFITDAKSEF